MTVLIVISDYVHQRGICLRHLRNKCQNHELLRYHAHNLAINTVTRYGTDL